MSGVKPFNNMRTLKFKAKPTNAFFATAIQMLGCSSRLPTNAEHCFACCPYCAQFDVINARSAVIGSWREPLLLD